jgi:tetratricopeptide (TPR) repeat protein
MNAEQPSRRELALRSLRDLADAFEAHGGNRVALIVFASRAELLFPLTQDIDHLRHVLDQIEAGEVPKLSDEEAASGTRIGAALRLATGSFDPARVNRPIVVLLSDGDDPAADGEWFEGALAAKEKNVRIHAVGFGNPGKDETIPAGDDVLIFDGKPVGTRLTEGPLKELAGGTGGVYLPARTEALKLGTYVLKFLDDDEEREEAPRDDKLPIYQLRYAWFILPAALLFMLTMLLNEGPPMTRNESKSSKPSASRPRRRFAAAVLTLLAILTLSAAEPSGADAFLRQGNDAYARGEYEESIKFYEQAEGATFDPGLIAFNKAAAHFRLGQHKEAIECYRRCLQDDSAPSERRARAHFDLGNALVDFAGKGPYTSAESVALGVGIVLHAGDDPYALGEAIAEYRACLLQKNLTPQLRADARHNLELAQLRWLKVRSKLPEDKKAGDPSEPPYRKKDDPKEYKEVKATKDTIRVKSDDVPEPSAKPKHVHSEGTPVVLPDQERVLNLSPEQALATLAKEALRIAQARRNQDHPRGPVVLTRKDW